jgi:hypothetical protein
MRDLRPFKQLRKASEHALNLDGPPQTSTGSGYALEIQSGSNSVGTGNPVRLKLADNRRQVACTIGCP